MGLATRFLVLLMRVLYALIKLVTRPRHKVVMISRLFSSTSQDFRMLQREYLAQQPRFTVVIKNHRKTTAFALPFQVVSEMYHLATSELCIVDSYVIPVSVLGHRKSLKVLQIWHALGAIKRFGKANLDRPEGRSSVLAKTLHMHEGYTWASTSGEPLRPVMAEAFGMDKRKVLALGSPRIDRLVDPELTRLDRNFITNKYPHLTERKTILYAPTFRRGEQIPITKLVAATDNEKYNLVIAVHPLSDQPKSTDQRVIIDLEVSTNTWLSVADYLVTDYSAILFDAVIADVPVYLYRYDDSLYKQRRGLFASVDRDLPGPKSTDATEILSAIESGEYDFNYLEEFKHKYIAHLDGSCTRRLVELTTTGLPR